MYRLTELRRLARAYIEATGISADTLSVRIGGRSNNRMIDRLLNGPGRNGVTARSIEAISDFFDQQWPADVPWPEDIARSGANKEAAE